jgi:hypothetical protein
MVLKLKTLLGENYQLAIKLYGDKLSPEDIEFLTRLCGRDYTFKTLADLKIEDKEAFDPWKDKQWTEALVQLRDYNSKIFPIIGFSFDSAKPVASRSMMRDRAEIIRIISEWPRIAKRNLRREISTPRNWKGFTELKNLVEYIDAHLSYLNNKTDKQKEMISRKIFSSDHPTFKEVADFVDDKENLIQGGHAYSKEVLYKLVQDNDYDLKIVWDNNDVVIVDVMSQPGMKLIGCNSLWCFTYGSEYGRAGEQWDRYSHNGHVYAIIDFKQPQDSPEFIHILIKPFEQQTDDESFLFDMANVEKYGRAEDIITHITGDQSVLSIFKWEDF